MGHGRKGTRDKGEKERGGKGTWGGEDRYDREKKCNGMEGMKECVCLNKSVVQHMDQEVEHNPYLRG